MSEGELMMMMMMVSRKRRSTTILLLLSADLLVNHTREQVRVALQLQRKLISFCISNFRRA